jgi:transcriptional regulator with XRE-family HTH domain
MSSRTSEKFPDRLRAARELRKLSQSELAERAGLQPSAVSHFETGQRAPSFDNLKRLADALDVTTDYLLGRTTEPTATGPNIDRLFRHAERMSKVDLEILADFAEVLAKRSKRRKTGESE